MTNILDWLLGGNKKEEPRGLLAPEPWPTAEEARAAREYKKKYGNFNEQMIEGAVAPNKDDERQQYRTGIPHTASAQILPAREALAYLNDGYGGPSKGLLSPEAADRLYAAQIAAQRNPVAALGFDADRIIHTPDGRFTAAGAYMPGSDMMWLGSDSPTTPVHESLHRGMEQMRRGAPGSTKGDDGVEPYREEMIVRRAMKNAYGDAEYNTYDPKGFMPSELKASREPDAKMDDHIKKLNKAANLLLAQRILARQGGVPW